MGWRWGARGEWLGWGLGYWVPFLLFVEWMSEVLMRIWSVKDGRSPDPEVGCRIEP